MHLLFVGMVDNIFALYHSTAFLTLFHTYVATTENVLGEILPFILPFVLGHLFSLSLFCCLDFGITNSNLFPSSIHINCSNFASGHKLKNKKLCELRASPAKLNVRGWWQKSTWIFLYTHVVLVHFVLNRYRNWFCWCWK